MLVWCNLFKSDYTRICLSGEQLVHLAADADAIVTAYIQHFLYNLWCLWRRWQQILHFWSMWLIFPEAAWLNREKTHGTATCSADRYNAALFLERQTRRGMFLRKSVQLKPVSVFLLRFTDSLFGRFKVHMSVYFCLLSTWHQLGVCYWSTCFSRQ